MAERHTSRRLFIKTAALGLTAIVVVQLTSAPWNATHIATSQSAPAGSVADTHLYIPAVAYELPLQAVVVSTNSNMYFGSGYETISSGYVLNLSTEPLYSVTMLLYMTVYTYGPNGTFVTGTRTNVATTVFTATLPGQKNPFVYQKTTGRYTSFKVDNASINRAVNKTIGDPTYVPLDASNWVTGSYLITGTVRNNSGVPVRDARVFIMYTYPDVCPWSNAGILTTTLQPGEATEYYAWPCHPGLTYPVAQGVAVP